MRKAIEMTGLRFGLLTVVKRIPNRPGSTAARWQCLCDCGKRTKATGGALRFGAIKSCGCGKRAADMVGQRFGMLTVTARVRTNAMHGGPQWYCLCECGEVSIHDGSTLRRGHAVSCGCRKVKHGGRRLPEYETWCRIEEALLQPEQ